MGIDVLKQWAELGAAVLSVLIAVGGVWWKLSRSFAKTELKLEAVDVALKHMQALLTELSQLSIRLSTKLEEREKDTLRLEGAMEVQRRDLVQVIAGLQQATSSLDSMWRTLQTLFPDRVPRRASDKHDR